MRISRTTSQYDNRPTTVELSWEDLGALLKTPREVTCATSARTKSGQMISTTVCPSLTRELNGARLPDKCEARKIDMWSPSIFDGNGKSKKNVVAMECLTFDIDHKTKDEFLKTLASVEAAGLACIMHTTHSHDPAHDDWCARLVLKLTAPVDLSNKTEAQLRAFYIAVAAKYGIPYDKQTKDHTRIFFMPSVPRGGPTYRFAMVPGASVDWFEATPIRGEVVSGWSEEAEAFPQGTLPPSDTVFDIAGMYEKILRSKQIEPEIKEAFKRSRDGKEFAKEGARDTTLYKAASKAAFCCYDAPLGALLELFRGGCTAMAPRTDPDGRTWLGKVEFDLERALERREAEKAQIAAEKAMAEAAGLIGTVASVPAGSTVSTSGPTYSEEDFKAFYASQGCANELEFRTRWVIRKEGANWIFENGRYGKAISDRDMWLAVPRNLARSGIPLMMEGKDGLPSPKPWQQAIQMHSSQAEGGVIGNLSIKHSTYDPVLRVFTEAICPPRELAPEYDPDIEEWLKRFNNPLLLDWLAAFPQLSVPTALLYLKGPKGIGKTLLPTGLARLWHFSGPTRFKDVIGTAFNSAIAECPLIFADEGLPHVPGIMDEIRSVLANDRHSLNRKYMPTVTVVGHLRMVVSGNNDKILNTNAELGEDDVDAVAARILYVDMTNNHAPAEWITHLKKTKSRGHITAWVEQDKIIKHVLWLAQNRPPVTEYDRTIGGGSLDFAENLATTSGNVPAVLEFLAHYLGEPPSSRQPTKLARIGQGRILVSTELLSDKALFERYVPSRRVLPANKISEALAQIRTSTEEVEGRAYHVLRVHTVLGWMRRHQVGDYHGAKARIEAP